MGKPAQASTEPYSEGYKQRCMTAWYAAGRPDNVNRIWEVIPEDEKGRKPNKSLLPLWRDEYGWDIWADSIDAKAMAQIEDKLVGAKVLMLEEQASRAREMQTKGMEYLRTVGFDSSASAVNALVQGAKMERLSRGISERIEKLLSMDNESLTKEALRLLEGAKESREILDIEVEDIDDDEEI